MDQLDIVTDSNIIWNENPVSWELHEWHGIGSSGI